ncbi:MAG: transglycosylase SLT domain-containing protein [Deltaproteobacteria bacterium]|nr:transglycosylase SLT domain-containing protein [Deltaproteobacteria bacterium]
MTTLTTIIAAVIVTLQPKVTPERAEVYAVAIEQTARKYDVDWTLLTAIINRESHFQPYNISRTNDYGMGQHHCPSFYCGKHPTPEQKACLLDAVCNIDLTGQELVYKKKTCARKGKRCADWVQMYNPGSKGYAQRTRALEAQIKQMAAKHRVLVERLEGKPVL